MKTFRINCTIDAWLSDIEIEAEDEEAAVEQLKDMYLKDIIDQMEDDIAFDVKDVDMEVESETAYFDFDVSNITWIDPTTDDQAIISKEGWVLPTSVQLRGISVSSSMGGEIIDEDITDEVMDQLGRIVGYKYDPVFRPCDIKIVKRF